jgi:hypothetical protein
MYSTVPDLRGHNTHFCGARRPWDLGLLAGRLAAGPLAVDAAAERGLQPVDQAGVGERSAGALARA